MCSAADAVQMQAMLTIMSRYMPLRMLGSLGLGNQLAQAGVWPRRVQSLGPQSAAAACAQGLAKSIAWDGEGATCLMEVAASQTIRITDWLCVAAS